MKTHKRPPKCTCGHSWDNHHHGCIMNPNVPTCEHKIGICGGVAAQECEETMVNGEILVEKEEDMCYCGGYVNSVTKMKLGDIEYPRPEQWKR